MSNDENRPAMDEPADAVRDDAVRDLVPRPVLAAQPMSPWLEETGFGPPAPSGGAGISTYLHALRRRWLVAAVLGVICCGIAFAAVQYTAKDQYTATALIRVVSEDKLVFDVNRGDAASIDTLQQYLQQRYVLEAAIRQVKLAMKEAKEGDDVTKVRLLEEIDPAAVLGKVLKTDCPGKAEILRIRLTRDIREESAILVNAVLDAFIEEVVSAESGRMRERLGELDRIYFAMQEELRTKKSEERRLADSMRVTRSPAEEMRLSLAKDKLLSFHSRQSSTQFELRNLQRRVGHSQDLLAGIIGLQALGHPASRANFLVYQTMLENADNLAISETELDALADLDALALQFDQRKDYLEAWIQQMKDLITDKYLEENPTLLMGPERELSDVERQLAERRAALKQEMQRRRQTEIETKTAEFQAQIASLQEQLGELDTDIAKQEELIEKLFGPDASDSLDSEMMQAEIKWKDSVFAEIAAERHRVQVELERHQSRIAVPQRAIAPKSPDETARVPLLIMAMIGGFLLPVVCITWWDTRGKRINSPLEISDGLGLNVIGSVPVIPARAIGNLNGPSKRHRQWRARLDESVNGIVATLLRKAELEKLRVVLVTSAMSGEGKTTLATHLALSLARTGKRTVLVDFDLRRPALDGVFGVPLQPGVSEVLSGSCDLADLVQPTETENLSLVTAGRIDARVMASLAGGAPGVLFQRLRAEYDFVVVDGSPVLPVVDARYVGQHADAVILSVLRDVSQAPKVSAAWEILVSLGIHAIGVVVTGSSEEAYYRKSGYEQTIPA